MSEATQPKSAARIAWLFGLPIATLILIAWSSMALVSRELASARAAQTELLRMREVLTELQAVLSLLQDAETGERGYIITDQDRFLQPFEAAERAIPVHLNKLASLLAINDEAKAQHLITRAQAQMSFLRQVVELQRNGETSKAVDLVRMESGKAQMDAIRSDVQSLEQDQQRLLAQRIDAFTKDSLRSERTVQLALLAAVVLVVGAGGLLFRYAHRRLLAERAADQASQLLRSTMDNINEGVVVYDQEMRVVGWNARFLELRRLDAAGMRIGMTAHELMQLAEPMTIQISGGVYESRSAAPGFGNVSEPFDGEATSASGLVLRVWGRPIAYSNYIVTVSDVTALRKSEAAYRDRAARLNSTLDNVVDAIITINESGSIESWNKGAERLFGYAATEVLQRNIYKLMPDPHAGAHGGYLRDHSHSGERPMTGRRQQIEAIHKDGHKIPVDLGISEMRIDNRRLFVGIVRDISERLEIDRMKSGFVSTVSHELRTPLTSIGGSLGLLAGGAAGQLSSKAARLIDIAKQNSDRLVRLINDILDLEKVESGKLELHLEQQRLAPIIEQAIELNRGYAQGFGVTIQFQAQDIDSNVLVDRDRFIQVLTNLLSNAVKYSPKDGVVQVALRAIGDNVQVNVLDDGPGIPPAFQKRIFQRFSQADSSDARAKGGTGLGLSIAKTLVERFGGAIDFDRERANGANFFITLPAIKGAAPRVAPASTALPAPHILICEDDPDIAEVLSATLHSAGMKVDTVDTAHVARAAIQEDRFDLVLMDVHLPDANGLDVVGEIRAHESSRTLPVIVMTAGGSDARNSDEVQALKLADWLQKPIGPERVVEAIRAALTTHDNDRFRVLHVEDDPSLTELVRTVLEGPARVVAAHSLAAARALVAEETFDLVILDIALGDGSGLELLPLLQTCARPPAVLVYTASEPSPEVVAAVDGVIVKSRHSVAEFIASIGDVSKAHTRKNLSAA